MKRKYIVKPGHITSVNDGDRHYISAHKLIELYRVDAKECVVTGGDRLRNLHGKFLILEPRHESSDYKLENCREVEI